MNIVTGRFIAEEVSLDGNHFQDCTLDKCTLSYDGGAVIFERTRILGCCYIFGSEARRTVDLLRVVGILCETFSGGVGECLVLN